MKMKRKLFPILAALVPLLLVGVMTAEAVDFNFSGMFRPRYEMNEQQDFSSVTLENHWFSTLARLNVEAVISENISVFLQFQSHGEWGDPTVQGTSLSGSGNAGSRSAFNPNDKLHDVGFHQAFVNFNNFFGVQNLGLKLGRQEVILDGHRLFGNTIWTAMQAHDAIRLNYNSGNLSTSYVYSKVQEYANCCGLASGPNNGSPSDVMDADAHILYASLNGVAGGKFSAIFAALDNDTFNDDSTNAFSGYPRDINYDDNNIYTVGARQAGQLFGIDYRAEFYYQWGEANGVAERNFSSANSNDLEDVFDNDIENWDRSAYMFGVRVGKKFNNVMWKPSFTVWYDHLSGTDEDDLETGEFSSFNTLFDTGHKFYGLMDLFLNQNGGRDTSYLGLQDLAFKSSIQPTSKIILKADLHMFWTETTVDCPDSIAGCDAASNNMLGNWIQSQQTNATDQDWGSYLGHELDITAVYKYAPSTTFTIGYSHFWADNWFHMVGINSAASIQRGTNNFNDDSNHPGLGDNASWAYVQMLVKF
jgi:hypothetical protein